MLRTGTDRGPGAVSRCARRAGRGFTLFELLVVIAIIGILAGLLLPALGKAKVAARVAQAKIDIKNIEGSISKYENDYSRYPASPKAREAAKDGDFTFGTWNFQPGGNSVLMSNKKGPLPDIQNTPTRTDYENSNAEIMSALLDFERFKNNMATWNLNHALNPNKTVYLNVKEVSDLKSPGVGPDGVFRDPWGNPYIITLDLNADNKCRDAFYKLASVSHVPGGRAEQGLNGLYRSTTGDTFEANKTIMVWSFGPDGKISEAVPANAGVNKDNILSW